MKSLGVIDATAPSVARSRSVIYIVIGVILAFLLWSYYAPLNAVVRGTGRVEPRDATQSIQNLEGGIVQSILVREVDLVTAGQLLAQMDDTAYRSAYDELLGREALLEMQILRLQAEANPEQSGALAIPERLAERAPQAALTEQSLFIARMDQYRETLGVLSRIKESRDAELLLLEPLVERGAIPETDLIRVQQSVLMVAQEITEHRTGVEAARMQALSEQQAELAQIRQQLRVRAAQVERAELRAPMDGIVNRVVVRTAGGVIAPGGPILEIIPLDDALVVAGRIKPQDIGPVFVGMGASVKLTAFDYRDYGSLAGAVVHLSADTVTDPETNDPEPYYEIVVELDSQTLTGPKGEVFIRPGMLATVELDAGQNTVFHYLFNPILRASEAFSEPD
ncbi:HlyD family efflux transporter periplasmic adaptor subunit [Roseobacter sp. AzwK-3b]|uniref:HlyD family efflux transporter periplasmic adaptor subunit n=1 Tax=Roseobacter sp. AzwK-3b TaxID=351016 RepID=UPI0009FCD164|nr:HlyD family efflux transporter periplasmic adaptor subunit [Roseobacter sp. AzwK-3b]